MMRDLLISEFARRPRVNPSHVYDRISGRELVRASTRNEIALAAGAGIRQRQEQNFVSLIGQSPGERNWRRPQEGKGQAPVVSPMRNRRLPG
jgi:hypothetical protein